MEKEIKGIATSIRESWKSAAWWQRIFQVILFPITILLIVLLFSFVTKRPPTK